jgi:hypothetical protein
MISEKSSTNPESFINFEGGRRIDLAISGGNTHICKKSSVETLFRESVLIPIYEIRKQIY